MTFESKNRMGRLVGYAIAFLAAAIALGCLYAAKAEATTCNVVNGVRCFPQHQVVQQVVKHAAPVAVVQKAVAAPVVTYAQPLYQVGQHLQRQALDTNAFRHSQEYLEYLQLKGFQAGVAATIQVREAALQQPQQWSQQAKEPAQPQSLPQAQPPVAPTPTPENQVPVEGDWFGQRYPTVASACMGCHGGKDPANPAGGLALDGTIPITGPNSNNYETSTGDVVSLPYLILDKAFNGHMPPTKPLTDQEFSSLLGEILGEETAQPQELQAPGV